MDMVLDMATATPGDLVRIFLHMQTTHLTSDSSASPAFQPSFFGGFPTISRVIPAQEAEIEKEEADDADIPVVTVQHNIEALPLPPQTLVSNSKFRNPIPPPIPAGIVQATQPTFGQVAIRV